MSAGRAKVVGWVLFAVVFLAPLAWLFVSIWWRWEVPENVGPPSARRRARMERMSGVPRSGGTRRRRARATAPASAKATRRPADAGLVMWCGRAAGNEIEVRFFNASGSDLKIVAPGSAGGALRVVRSGVELPSPAPAVFDDEIDAVVRMRPGTTHEVRVAGKFPAGPVTVVYDTRGEGLPEGVWKGRTVFSTR